jgi:hypothetical protein
MDFFHSKGWLVRHSSDLLGVHVGYDLLLEKGPERLTVKVKGSNKPYSGIPDLYETSVDNQGLVADLLCVGYFPAGRPEKLAVIPRAEIPRKAFTPKVSYRVSNDYKNQKRISKFLFDTDSPWP